MDDRSALSHRAALAAGAVAKRRHWTLRAARLIAWTAPVAAVAVFGATAMAQKTQWDGVYTLGQAARGKALYGQACATCHGADLKGQTNAPALAGGGFAAKWNAFTLGDLHARIRTTMPLSKPGTLTPAQTSDLIAYLLSANGYAIGDKELPARAAGLESIRFSASPYGATGAVSIRKPGEPNTGAVQVTPGLMLRPDDRGEAPADTANLGPGPWEFDTALHRIKVTKVAGDLNRPWGLAWLPNGDILVTERAGRLRIIRNGVLDPNPITGLPDILVRDLDGLMDIALHPDFAKNHLVYFTYGKPNSNMEGSPTLARGRYDGTNVLKDVEDLFIAQPSTPRRSVQGSMARILFTPDGYLFMTVSNNNQNRLSAQDPSSHRGKILRLKDDGSAAPGNPYIAEDRSDFGLAYQPEIWSIGHRGALGLALHPKTGELFESEDGPQGGDEINVIKPGHNYGWPAISLGREYDGRYIPHEKEGMEQPLVYWMPAIGVGGIGFYNGDKFPRWKGNLFAGALRGQHIVRITFNEKGLPIPDGTKWNREQLLGSLNQRIRLVREGPDGNLYVLTDFSAGGSVLKIEPAPPPAQAGS